MSVFRIRCPLPGTSQSWEWAFVEKGAKPSTGEGPLTQLPQALLKRAQLIELVIPASQSLITRAHLPPSAKRRSGSLLAYAVEESTASEPDANQVTWLGSTGGADILAVVDRQQLGSWREALGAAGIHDYAVCCETLMLPLPAGGWSCVWDGREGFVRSGEFEGAATDCGDRQTPPLSLSLMIEGAKARKEPPASIVIHATEPNAAPEVEAWQRILGIKMVSAKRWDWKSAPPDAGISLALEHRRWRVSPGLLARLRPVVWIAGIALAIHSAALMADWARLAREQQTLRAQMETRFRSVFPDAVAVADPGLQMRRKLAEARRAANKADDGDFAVIVGKVAAALREMPVGALRTISYESGRMTLEFAAADEAMVRRITGHLAQAGLIVDPMAPARAGRDTVALTVRAA